jgi:hypothetical protein
LSPTRLPGGLAPSQAWTLAREMGPRWLAARGAHALRQRTGLLERRFPARDWADFRLADLARPGTAEADPERLHERLRDGAGPAFFFTPADLPRRRAVLQPLVPAAERQRLTAFAAGLQLPDWHRHPGTGETWPLSPWTRLGDFGGADVKALWEPARFGAAWDLVRAAWIAEAPGAGEAFWQLAASFREANPPGRGVHWMCGQEAAFRVLAWCFALAALAADPATTPERVGWMVTMLAAHGLRIEANLAFALSQKNNHGINEALGLWTLGTLFPGLAAAARWERRGRALLEREARRQIADDGSYVQHSLNYHRLILESFSWALRLGDLAGRPFSAALRERVGRAAELLLALTDEAAGRAPNYGSNDGARLLPLHGCDFGDQRPALGLALWVTRGRRAFAPGPWDELAVWLCGQAPLAARLNQTPLAARLNQAPSADLAAPEGGYYTLRAGTSWAFTRCATYRDRPAQADLLHVDLWWRGANVLGDPGTFAYDAPPPWNNGLAGTAVHNAPAVDGRDQMERGPRFVWLGWPHGRLLRSGASPDGAVRWLEGEHDGYVRRLGVVHRRTLLHAGEDFWLIVDDLLGTGPHDLAWCWLLPEATAWELAADGAAARAELPPGPVHLTFAGALAGGTITLRALYGEEPGPFGWTSPRYGERRPALALRRTVRTELPARCVLAVGLGAPVAVTGHLEVIGPAGRLDLDLAPLTSSADTVVRSAVFSPRP